jgi:SRSO17 transposase
LARKTAEPIAREHGVPRKPIQVFVGRGKWDDEAVMAELRVHVGEVLGDPEAVLVLDPSTFPKKGTHSCGVERPVRTRQAPDIRCQGQAGRVGPEERLVVIRRAAPGPADPEISYHVSNAAGSVGLEKVVAARFRRSQIEQLFAHGKGEAGLDQYEVRSWVGWHHHVTLSLLALWFLGLERLTVGEKKSGRDRAADSGDPQPAAASSSPHQRRDRRRGEPRLAAPRGVADLPLVRYHRLLSAAAKLERLRVERLQ